MLLFSTLVVFLVLHSNKSTWWQPRDLVNEMTAIELGLKDFIQNLEIPRLSNEEQATFEHELTVQEIKNV